MPKATTSAPDAHPPSTTSRLETPKHTATQPSLSTSLKRKLQVYVEIPPSPLHTQRKTKHEAFRTTLSKRSQRKVTSFPHKQTNGTSSSETSRSSTPVQKKPKLSNVEVVITQDSPTRLPAVQTKPAFTHPHVQAALTGVENSRLRCHQCGLSRNDIDLVHCSRNACKLRFCSGCLKNRYARSINAIKDYGIPSNEDERLGHVLTRGYIWSCFKCRKECNCSKCMRSQGLEPLGKVKGLSLRKSANTPVVLVSKLTAKHQPLPDKQTAPVPKKSKPSVSRKRKAVPQPTWTPIPTELSLEEVEDRVFLREFAVRFEQLMEISSTRMDELDQFESMPFVLVKSLLQNILNLIAPDMDEEPKKIIRAVVKQLSRPIPSQVWPPLEELRSSLASTSFQLHIPEPAAPRGRATTQSLPSRSATPVVPPTRTLPSRASKTARSASAESDPNPPVATRDDVVEPEQFIPVLKSLVHAALQLPSCRLEIENGLNDIKDENRRYWSAVKEENERWAEESATLSEQKEKGMANGTAGFDKIAWAKKHKAALVAHKQTLSDLENEHNIKCQGWLSRFTPLGKDIHGRIYYAGTSFDKKSKCSLEDASQLNKWSWFLAVWGKGGSESDGETNRWWGFHDPTEIRALAKWIGATAAEDEEDGNCAKEDVFFAERTNVTKEVHPDEDDEALDHRRVQVERRRLPTYKEVTDLVKSLNTYANTLESRFVKVKK